MIEPRAKVVGTGNLTVFYVSTPIGTELTTVADVLAELREVTSAMQRAGDDCAHELANHPKGMWYWSSIFLAMLDQFEKEQEK